MSQYKNERNLKKHIKKQANRSHEKFLARNYAQQTQEFSFLSILDATDPTAQVLLALLLTAHCIPSTSAQPKALIASESASSAPETFVALRSTQVQSFPSSTTFFSGPLNVYQCPVPSYLPKTDRNICPKPNRDQITQPFPLIVEGLSHSKTRAVVQAVNMKIPIVEDLKELYVNINRFSGGGESRIFIAETANQEKRIVGTGIRTFNPRYGIIPRFYPYVDLDKTHQFSDYIPQTFGAYYVPAGHINEMTGVNFEWPFTMPEDLILCIETEYLPLSLPVANISDFMEPRTVFGEVLGQYVLQRVAKCYIADDKPRHHLYRNNQESVHYRIGDVHYLFPPGISAHRIDYDAMTHLNEEKVNEPFRFSEAGLVFEYVSESMQCFLTDINQKGYFQAIKLHFSEFLIAEEELKKHLNAKYFDLTELAEKELKMHPTQQVASLHG